MKAINILATVAIFASCANGFAPHVSVAVFKQNSALRHDRSTEALSLNMAEEGKKKRRRRKQPQDSTVGPETPSPESIPMMDENNSSTSTPSFEELKSLANFTPSKGKASFNPPLNQESSSVKNLSVGGIVDSSDREDAMVELPDIRDALKNKELKKLEQEKQEVRARPKISRKDRKALLQLLEEQPFADADDSYFEEEEYGTVSALLAEGAKPFLGIPPGPLQVGHFIGALGIILCAFVDYPGFPLTNLPTPLRDSLQGGLFTIYLINSGLAVLATFKAKERGQPAGLWAAKTFSVGGLALDQLTQLPTLRQMEELKNRKGARAVKKR